MTPTFDSRQLIRTLFRIAGILAVCHLINFAAGEPSWQAERLFNMGYDNNIPTWFASFLWALTAWAAFRCSKFGKQAAEGLLWTAAALGFLALSIDEVAMIHESVFGTIAKVLPADVYRKIESEFWATNWPIFGAPFLLAGLIWAVVTFRRLLRGSRRAAGLVFRGIGLVILGGAGLEMTTNLFNHESLQWVWEIENVFEELLEMAGTIVIMAGLFEHERLLREREIKPETLFSNQESEAVLCRD